MVASLKPVRRLFRRFAKTDATRWRSACAMQVIAISKPVVGGRTCLLLRACKPAARGAFCRPGRRSKGPPPFRDAAPTIEQAATGRAAAAEGNTMRQMTLVGFLQA